MKFNLNIHKKVLLLLAVIFLSACESSFLEREPIANYDADSYYNQSSSTANEAVLGLYNAFYRDGMYKRNIWWAEESGSDNAYFATFGDDIDMYQVRPDNGEVNNIWTNHYDLINRSMHVIAKIPGTPMDQTELNALIGEAYFLQSLMYFNLVRYFGGVPIVKEIPTPENIFGLTRNTKEEVYEHIISNLEDYAIPALQVTPSQLGRATKGAAQTLLADVYLTLASEQNNTDYYTKVVDLTSAVIQSGAYNLQPNYADNFNMKENGIESIFEIQNANLWDRGGQEFQWWAAHGGGWANLAITDDLVNAYKTSNIDLGGGVVLQDTRGDVTVLEKGETLKNVDFTNGNLVHRPQKYVDMPGMDVGGSQVFFLNSGQNTYVYRYAEVLLMQAEALNKLGQPGALELVNMIRRRAFGQPIDVVNPNVDLPAMSQTALDEAIFKERRLEFALESKRWHDLVRTGRAITVLNSHSNVTNGPLKTIDESSLLFPIPRTTLNHYPNWPVNPANNR